MHPSWSILLFTTTAGLAQGLVVALALACLLGAVPHAAFLAAALTAATGLLVTALAASFFHLGHPRRAWRAALMWRTSWMSREVIVLPVFIALVAGWAAATLFAAPATITHTLLPLAALVLAIALWYCTAMIYACLRFIQEWAHPLTIVNYTLLGLSSGLILAGALAVPGGESELQAFMTPWALAVTVLAWGTRAQALRRNAALRPKSTLQSATGIRSTPLVQKSMGMSAGSFNTREFFHGVRPFVLRRTRIMFQMLAFAAPLVLVGLASFRGTGGLWLLAVPVQFVGLLAERWFFFAQARHPQNLYYQSVS
ncbi:dimethyl sulfoxide reductase anchor subunit family protein [Ramlibacter sp. AN1133]|uniref:dimethyl sulfoxide reductase anchor subunit family protein n=1 Tax=Ramlibacter sp. AN1133 TaxID=3133429 RepID=UPI0030BE208F